MTRDELLLACFGRDDLKPGTRILETKEGTDVIAHLDLSYRRVVVGQTTLTVAAISNLCTDPARRRRGFATTLVRRAHDEARDHPMIEYVGVFALYDGLFSRLGYQQVDPAGNPDLLVASLAGEPFGWYLPIDVRGGW